MMLKGSGTRRRKCKQCQEKKPACDGFIVGVNWVCSEQCGYELSISTLNKQRERSKQKVRQSQAKAEKAARETHRERKKALKPKSKTLAEAQSAFNSFVRVRDYYDPCISCGKSRDHVEAEQGWKVGGCWDAGHFMTRGAKGQLRFVLFNVHKQCKSCNAGGGKFSSKAATVDKQYRVNLIKKIGIEKVELLESNNDIDTRKNDVEYLERIKKIFNRRARWYKKRRSL